MRKINLLEVASAYFRSISPTSEQMRIAQVRKQVCESCDFLVYRKFRKMHVCGACGCPISKKIFSPLPGIVACPKKFWDE